MNCYEFELGVVALARNQLMDAVDREQGMTHAENCARCAGRLAAERTLLAGVAAVVSEVARAQAPARVEAALLAAFHEQVLAAGPPAIKNAPVGRRNWSHWRLVAAAAMIPIVVSALALFWLYSNSSNEKQETQAVVLPAPISPDPEGDREAVSYLASDGVSRQGRPRASRAKPKAPEVVTEFYPVMDGEDLDSLEAVQILRVELPASALTDAGLSLGPDGSTRPVKADVVLGHDGLARAIRFVR